MENKTVEIIVGSTRPGSIGKQIAEWLNQQIIKQDGLSSEIIELSKINLPFLDEAEHPSKEMYTKDHTKLWSTRIKEGAAYIWLTPEYNAGYPAPLKNAIDFLYQEWGNKPVLIVSYGVRGGTTANKQLVEVAERLKMRVVKPSIELTITPTMRTESGQLNNPSADFIEYEDKLKVAFSALSNLVNG